MVLVLVFLRCLLRLQHYGLCCRGIGESLVLQAKPLLATPQGLDRLGDHLDLIPTVTAQIGERMTTTVKSVEAAHAIAADVAAEIVAGAVDRERSGELPIEALRRVGESGLLGILVPAEFGG